jgi:hypothetical protein
MIPIARRQVCQVRRIGLVQLTCKLRMLMLNMR